MFTFVAVISLPAGSTGLCACAIDKIADRLVKTVPTNIAARFSNLPLSHSTEQVKFSSCKIVQTQFDINVACILDKCVNYGAISALFHVYFTKGEQR